MQEATEQSGFEIPESINENSVALFMAEHPDLHSGVPLNITKGIAFFLVKKDYLNSENFLAVTARAVKLINTLYSLIGEDYFKSNVFRYVTDRENPFEVLDSIKSNAQFWVDIYGPDFFKRYSPRSKERKTQLRADIDDDFYLSAKGGNGVTNFGLDLAIGVKSHKVAPNIPKGEIWRMGMDTEVVEDERILRVIQSGSGVRQSAKGFEDKSKMFDKFKKRYKITPQRLLALMSLYVGHDLGFERARSVTLYGIRQKRLNLTQGSWINFDYDGLFGGVGFQKTDSLIWRETNVGKGFYDGLTGRDGSCSGLQIHEVKALDLAIRSFNELRDVLDETHRNPIRLCEDDTRESVAEAMKAFAKIHRK